MRWKWAKPRWGEEGRELLNYSEGDSRRNFWFVCTLNCTKFSQEFQIILTKRKEFLLLVFIWNSMECVGLFWIYRCHHHHHQWNQSSDIEDGLLDSFCRSNTKKKPIASSEIKWQTFQSHFFSRMKWILTLPFGKTCILLLYQTFSLFSSPCAHRLAIQSIFFCCTELNFDGLAAIH